MSEFNLIKYFTNRVSINDFGSHISNYIDLYIKPLKSWRKAINNQNSSYNFIILHLIYYLFFSLLIIKDEKQVVFFVLLEVAITIIPTLIFIAPFLFFLKIGKKRMKWNRLFRLFLVVKFQFFPLISLILLFAKYTGIEELYVLVDNLLAVIILFFIGLMPLLIRIKLWQKILYIVSNYILFQLFIVIVIYIMMSFESKLFNSDSEMSKFHSYTPALELLDFKTTGGHSFDFINFNNYYVIIKPKPINSEYYQIEGTQYSTNSFDLFYSIKEANMYRKKLIYYDSISVISDLDYISKKEKYKLYPVNTELTRCKMDSLKKDFDSRIQKDIELTFKLKNSSPFKSNKKYYENLWIYLTEYKKPFESSEIRHGIIESDQLSSIIILDDSTKVFKYLIDTNRYSADFHKSRSNIKQLEVKFEKREKMSSILMEILFFPCNLIIDSI